MKKIIVMLLAILTTITIANAQKSTIDQIIERGELRVGTSEFVPWSFKSTKGEYVGFEIDVAKALAKDLGVELKHVIVPWKDIIAGLIAEDYDLIIAGMHATTKRNLQINFTDSYNSTLGTDVVVNSSKIARGQTRSELNNPETIIGAVTGTTALLAAKEFFPKAVIREYDGYEPIQADLLKGDVNMWVSSAPAPSFFAADNPKKLHKPFKQTLTFQHVGMGVRKNDPDTLNILNNWIAAQTQSGFLGKRAKYWYTTRRWQNLVPK